MEAEERVHLCITLGETSAMYKHCFLLQLPIGVLSYIEVVHEFLFPTQSLQRVATKKAKFSGKQQILHQETIKTMN